MQVNVKFEDYLISDEQAETFAYNIYREIAEYIKTNFENFFEWNLETISVNLILTTDGITHKENNYIYGPCKYEHNR